jgi:cytochrome P450/NADPH-cytochrome P450 reductase
MWSSIFRPEERTAAPGEEAAGADGIPIPSGPAPLPIIGNLRDLTGPTNQDIPGHPDSGLHMHLPRLVAEYGGFFTIKIPSGMLGAPVNKFGDTTAVLADPDLLGEMFDRHGDFQKRLMKFTPVRAGLGGTGLFTTDDDEPIHDQAARVLLPAFSMKGMQEYFTIIMETTETLTQQFVERCAAGPVELHPVLSCYTLDIIGKVGFGQDFGSLTGPCRFLDLFSEFAETQVSMASGLGGFGGSFKPTKIMAGIAKGDVANLKRITGQILEEVQAVIAAKKQSLFGDGGEEASGCPLSGAAPAGGCPFAAAGGGVKDMATRMFTVADPETGEKLPEENIINQVSTFLVAGHDSTSTAITMLLYHVALDPLVEERVYEEVMSVVGHGPITWEALGRMKYCTQVVKENLRLFPPAPHFVKTSPPDQAVKLGPYLVPAGTTFVCSTWGLHRNPKVYPDPLKFDPDRWSDENAATRSPYAWLPFSYGKRGCIGQQLSLIEQRVCLATLCRKFHLRVDPSSKVTVTTPLFLDPQGIFLRCVPRGEGVERPLPSAPPLATAAPSQAGDIGEVEELKGKRLVVLYGSNMGTCEDFADRAAASGSGLGMAVEKHPLDKVASGLPLPKGADGVVIVVTSVYNGQPPDNARRFSEWLDSSDAQAALEGVRFGVFGCGNKQWAATFMKFPRKVQERLEDAGGKPMVPMGEGDMDGGEAEFSFVRWLVSVSVALLQAHGAQIPDSIKESMYPRSPVYEVYQKLDFKADDLKTEDVDAILQYGRRQAMKSFLSGNKAFPAEVTCNRELLTAQAQGRSTRHIEVKLPEGTSYTAGDHLGVLGANPDEVVFAYMDQLGLPHDAVLRLEMEEGESVSTVALGKKMPAFSTLAFHFELQQPASRPQLYALSKLASDPKEAEHLRGLAEYGRDNSGEATPTGGGADEYERYVLKGRRTLLEVLQEHPSVKVSAGAVLGMLPPNKPRYYSISSSPKHSPGTVTVSVSVVQGPSPTGRRHLGLCSNYLKGQACQKRFPPTVMPSKPLGPKGKGMAVFTFVKDTGSSFRLPAADVPVIMVGPGTGVAPMRGFIQDRVADGRTQNVLFFGCRDDSDYIYRDELEAWEKAGSLKLFVAFSRKEGTPKTYVQNLISQQAALVADYIGKGAYFYVCGDASKMAPDVKATVSRVLTEAGLGNDCVEKMSAEGKYCEDVWAAQSI